MGNAVELYIFQPISAKRLKTDCKSMFLLSWEKGESEEQTYFS